MTETMINPDFKDTLRFKKEEKTMDTNSLQALQQRREQREIE